jgi:S1-C subfamily serine protease
MRSFSLVITAAALLTSSLSLPLRAADNDAAAGRALVTRYADAIVGVELVVTIKVKAGDREMPPREQRIEVNGTVISPSGLTVTSLADVDPQTTFDAMRANAGGGRALELVGTDFKEVKLRLANGKEVPARFVLKDADLDLAFMAPDISGEEPKPEFPKYVKLDDATDGAVLDTYFCIERAAKALQRVPLVRTSSVAGIVEKPRRFYLMTAYGLGSGTAMFDRDGHVLGITLQNFAGGRRTGYVVLPAGDIAEIAKQAAVIQAQPKPAEPEKPAQPPSVTATPTAPATP